MRIWQEYTFEQMDRMYCFLHEKKLFHVSRCIPCTSGKEKCQMWHRIAAIEQAWKQRRDSAHDEGEVRPC